MSAYYNEIEPYAAQWLRNLIKKELIADGEVDTRSIVDVAPDDLRGFTQAHFFAGIGGWSHALRLAGWPDDRPIWTGSCPCQPFSVAGKGAGVDDPRHLWPHFHRLITAVRPPVVMGEQVAGQAGYGWLDGVRADLARESYASRGVDIPACSVDAPHIRQRLYWVAQNMEYTNVSYGERSGLSSGVYQKHNQLNSGSAHSHMADADNAQRRSHAEGRCDDDDGQNARREEEASGRQLGGSTDHDVADADSPAQQRGRGELPAEEGPEAGRFDLGPRGAGSFGSSHMADAECQRPQGGISRPRESESQTDQRSSAEHSGSHSRSQSHMADADNRRSFAQPDRDNRTLDGTICREEGAGDQLAIRSASRGANGTFWSDHIWLTGADGKARRAQPGIPLLAHGIPNRVGKLRAYGNAIVPQVAAEVIGAYMDCAQAWGKKDGNI